MDNFYMTILMSALNCYVNAVLRWREKFSKDATSPSKLERARQDLECAIAALENELDVAERSSRNAYNAIRAVRAYKSALYSAINDLNTARETLDFVASFSDYHREIMLCADAILLEPDERLLEIRDVLETTPAEKFMSWR